MLSFLKSFQNMVLFIFFVILFFLFLSFLSLIETINLIVYSRKHINEKYNSPFEHGVRAISKLFFYPIDPSKGEKVFVSASGTKHAHVGLVPSLSKVS